MCGIYIHIYDFMSPNAVIKQVNIAIIHGHANSCPYRVCKCLPRNRFTIDNDASCDVVVEGRRINKYAIRCIFVVQSKQRHKYAREPIAIIGAYYFVAIMMINRLTSP